MGYHLKPAAGGPHDLDIVRVGQYYAPDWGHREIVQNSFVNDRLFACPIFFPRPMTLDQVAIRCASSGGTGVAVRIGLYADNGQGLPGDLIRDFGTISQTAGNKTITISPALSLPAGLYHTAFVRNYGDAPQYHYAICSMSPYGWDIANARPFMCNHRTFTYGALPATWGSSTTFSEHGWLFMYRVLSLD